MLCKNIMQTRKEKKVLVKSLVTRLKESKAVVFSDFKGLSVKDMTILRRQLRKEKVFFQVFKKTLLAIALKEAGLEADVKNLKGQIVVAISSEDEVAAAKIIATMAKSNDNISIVGGTLEQKVLSREEVMSLAKLLSKEELLAKLVGTLKAPMSGLANVMVGNIRSLTQVLKAIEDIKQA